MRITLVGPTSPHRGGIVAHTEGARDALGAGANRVDVCGFSRLYPRWLVGDRPGSAQAPCREDRLIDTLAPRTWHAVARTISTDVLLVQYWTPVVAPALRTMLLRARAHRRVLVCHNAMPHERVPGARVLFRTIVSHCDAVIFHSRATFLSAFAGAPAHIPSAIVPMPLLLSPCGSLQRPPELGSDLEGDAEIVALVGHIRGYKGLGVLDRAWDEVARRRPRARLVVAGEPVGARRELARLATPGRRTMVIPRYLEDAELRWVLANARVVVLPYTGASQSGLLPLALRLAQRVVVSDVGGLGEQLSQLDGGCAGVSWVPAGESEPLSRALLAALGAAPDSEIRAARYGGGGQGEVVSSWQPFVHAVETLAAAGGTLVADSNSGLVGPSVQIEKRGDEVPRQAWYDAGRSAFGGAETHYT